MNRLMTYSYRAVGGDGKTRRGRLTANSEAEAFSKLRADNLSPVSLKPVTTKSARQSKPSLFRRKSELTDLELEESLSSLAVLLRAGADIRTALSVVGGENPTLREVSQGILGGASVEAGLAGVIPPAFAHLRGLIAAGEARGDLASGLEAASTVLATGRKIRQQLFEALSYPAFVFVTAMAALCVILLVVVPAIAPLLQDTGHDMPIYFGVIVDLSDGLRFGWIYVVAALALLGALVAVGWKYGDLKARFQVWMLAGPLGRIVRALVFGGFAKTLGQSLSSGASMTEALRLCQRGVSNQEARKRLDVVMTQIRQGRRLSEALRQVEGFPEPIIRLCEVGEASSSLGPMLSKAGMREEVQALAQIDKLSKLLGPALIILLGALIGGLMGGVLTALTDIGGAAGG